MKQALIFVAVGITLLGTALNVSAKHKVSFVAADGSAPAIVADDSGHLHAVFQRSKKHTANIFYTTSGDQAETWSSPQLEVSKTAGDSTDPRIAAEKSGAVDIVWRDTTFGEKSPDIFFSRSEDGGRTWTKPIDISNTPGISDESAIAVGPDNAIHVVWSDTSSGEKNRDIYYCFSKDGGKTWSKKGSRSTENISQTPGYSAQPAISVNVDGTVHVVWQEIDPGKAQSEIYHSARRNGVWEKAHDLSNGLRLSSHPSITSGSRRKVYVTWSEKSETPGRSDIWCATDSATTGEFGQPINISDTAGTSTEPIITADRADRVVIVWSDTTVGEKRPDIFGSISMDGLDKFSKATNLTDTETASIKPAVAIAGSKVALVWEEHEGNDKQLRVKAMELKQFAMGTSSSKEPD